MVRRVDDDFDALRAYLNSYSLQQLLANEGGKRAAKAGHRLYLCLLHLWAECSSNADKKHLKLAGAIVLPNSLEFAHLRECVSDVGVGFFCCIQGAYKAGQMCLRSSIENFLRFIVSPYNKKALTTTSIYELFDIAKVSPPFQGDGAKILINLRGTYSELCRYTHSGSLGHMVGIHALSHFPSLDSKAFQGWVRNGKKLVECFGSIMVLEAPNLFLKAHYSNKEVLEILIPEKIRLKLLGKK